MTHLSANIRLVSHFISSHLFCHSPSCLFWKTWQRRDKLPLSFTPVRVTALSYGWIEDGPPGLVKEQTALWITTGQFVSLSEGLSPYDDTLVNSAQALRSMSQKQKPPARMRILGEGRIYAANNRVDVFPEKEFCTGPIYNYRILWCIP